MLQAGELRLWPTVIAAPTSASPAVRASFRPEIVVGGTRTSVLVDQLAAFDVERFGDRVARL